MMTKALLGVVVAVATLGMVASAQTAKMSPEEYKKFYAEAAKRDAAAKAAWRKRHEVAQMAVVVYGSVIQNIDSGLLVSARNYSSKGYDFINDPPERPKAPEEVDKKHKWIWLNETVLLTGHPDKNAVVDEDTLNVIAYPIGTFEYESVKSAKKTVRRFTMSLDEASAYWTATTAENK